MISEKASTKSSELQIELFFGHRRHFKTEIETSVSVSNLKRPKVDLEAILEC